MRDNKRIFIFLMTFFTVIALGSLLFLSQTGSAFNRTNKSLGAETAVLTQTVINEPEEKAVEEPEEVAKEPDPEPPVVEDTMAAVAEASVEPEPEPEPEPEEPQIRYFSYKVGTQITILRLREEPSEFSDVKAKLAKGSTGYVIKPGSQWSRVISANGNEGYCSSEFLILTEMTAEEFPEKYRSMVEAPDEELSAPFESQIENREAFIQGKSAQASDTAADADVETDATAQTEGDAGTQTETSQIGTEPDNG